MRRGTQFDGFKPKPRVSQPRNAFTAVKGSGLQPAQHIGKDPRTTGAGFMPDLKPKGPFNFSIQAARQAQRFHIPNVNGKWTYPNGVVIFEPTTGNYRFTKPAAS